MTKIWWLASYPKSGNTWLRLFLSAYRHGCLDINRPHDVTIDDLQPALYETLAPGNLKALSNAEKHMLRPAMLLHLCAKDLDPLFVKTHCINARIDGMPTIPATITYGAVYLVRDPRNVAVSYAAHRGVSVDEIIQQMGNNQSMIPRDGAYQALGSWSQHVKSWTQSLPYPALAVRYEDLVAKPEVAFSAIVKFLMHELNENQLDAAIGMTGFDRLEALEQDSGFREATKHSWFFRQGPKSHWQETLTPKQAQRIETDHNAMMQDFGYL